MLLSIKLTIRNWWRNNIYFFISLFSLTIGLACYAYPRVCTVRFRTLFVRIRTLSSKPQTY